MLSLNDWSYISDKVKRDIRFCNVIFKSSTERSPLLRLNFSLRMRLWSKKQVMLCYSSAVRPHQTTRLVCQLTTRSHNLCLTHSPLPIFGINVYERDRRRRTLRAIPKQHTALWSIAHNKVMKIADDKNYQRVCVISAAILKTATNSFYRKIGFQAPFF